MHMYQWQKVISSGGSLFDSFWMKSQSELENIPLTSFSRLQLKAMWPYILEENVIKKKIVNLFWNSFPTSPREGIHHSWIESIIRWYLWSFISLSGPQVYAFALGWTGPPLIHSCTGALLLSLLTVCHADMLVCWPSVWWAYPQWARVPL